MLGKTHDQMQLERVAFFSDAVFAIAITLLVIEVRVPGIHPVSDAALGDALLRLIPNYIGFVISFFVIGRFWVGHHRTFGHLARVDEKLVWLNLLFLLTIAFLPYPTTLIANYLGLRVAVCFYAAWLALAGLLNAAVIRHALRGPLVGAHSQPDTRARVLRTSWSPLVIGALAFAAGLIQPLYVLVPLIASPLIIKLLGAQFPIRRRRAAG